MSLERLDTSIGYVRSNVVLVACEFNIWSNNKFAQWSRVKAEELWGPFDWPSVEASLKPFEDEVSVVWALFGAASSSHDSIIGPSAGHQEG